LSVVAVPSDQRMVVGILGAVRTVRPVWFQAVYMNVGICVAGGMLKSLIVLLVALRLSLVAIERWLDMRRADLIWGKSCAGVVAVKYREESSQYECQARVVLVDAWSVGWVEGCVFMGSGNVVVGMM